MQVTKNSQRSPIAWVPSSYLAEGIPFAMVIWVAGTMFKDLGHSDSEITIATGGVGIMWSLKPFYAGFLDMLGTKRMWVLAMHALLSVLFGAWALTLSMPNYFEVGIMLLWLLAFASATQDICIDGVYITTLDESQQGKYMGLQGFWTVGKIFATALVVGAAGHLQKQGLSPKDAWAIALAISMGAMVCLSIYHYWVLPSGSIPKRPENTAEVFRTFADQFTAFMRKPYLLGMLTFVFLYRMGEGFLLVEAPLFMQGEVGRGGLGMCATQAISAACPHFLEDKALIDGLISTVVSLAFGLLGGMFAGKYGLTRKTLVVMAICLNLPHLTFYILSCLVSPDATVGLPTIAVLVTLEKAGYAFGMVANMLYMMQQISPGKYHMTHYAFCTALMNLVLVPTQMASGVLADQLGFQTYFLLVMAASVPSVVAAYFAPFPNSRK